MFISFRYRKIRFHRCQYLSFCELSQTIDRYIELVTYINNRKTSTPRLFKIINQTNVIYQTIGQFFLCQKLKDRSVWWVSIHLINLNCSKCGAWIHMNFIDWPPPLPPFTSFRPPVLREKLYIVILLNSDNSLVYTLSSYWVVHFHAPSAFYVVLICLYIWGFSLV